MSEVDDGVDVQAWQAGPERVEALLGGRFGRAEPRRRAGAYLRGLLAPLERKNGWPLAGYAGAVSPDGVQRLVRTAGWDAEAVRDDLRGHVVAELGDPGGILAVDETGFVKQDVRSAGVARQYTGTTGKVDNCQVGVSLAYLPRAGDRALVDRGLYLPKAWTDDRRAAGRRASATTWRSRPNPSWPAACSSGRRPPVSRPLG